jgi:hypothetical protein
MRIIVITSSNKLLQFDSRKWHRAEAYARALNVRPEAFDTLPKGVGTYVRTSCVLTLLSCSVTVCRLLSGCVWYAAPFCSGGRGIVQRCV